MATFAEIQNGIVQRVIVADQSFIDSGAVGDPTNWVETFEDNTKRKYCGAGFEYHKDLDVFIAPAPYKDWVLDTNAKQYVSPVPKPAVPVGKIVLWDDDTKQWADVSVLADVVGIDVQPIDIQPVDVLPPQ